MDNLTHSLVGALLGRTGLERLTGRATPTLILAANLPDIDSFIAPLFGAAPITEHRGFSHGIGGLLLLPLVVSAIILAWDRWRPFNGQPVRPRALLLLAAIGTLSHPLLDFSNTYGVRLLEPLSNRWFYGDTLFIIDVWIWAALIAGFGLSRWREKAGRSDWHVPALAAFGAILAYVGLNAVISLKAEAVTARALARSIVPDMVVASPSPITFWKRRMLWRGQGLAGSGGYDPLAGWDQIRLDPQITRIGLSDPRLAASVKADADVRAFLFWSRMPVVFQQEGRAFLGDQRFLGRRTRGNFLIPLDSAAAAP